MNQNNIKEKMKSLEDKMNKFNAIVKDKADTVAIVGMESMDVIDKKLQDAKGNLAASQENYRLLSERGKSKLSSELIRAQMNFAETKKNVETKKSEIQKGIADKKYNHSKEEMEKAIEDILDYANTCAALAEMATEEAEIAYLEALEAQIAYDEQFGNKK